MPALRELLGWVEVWKIKKQTLISNTYRIIQHPTGDLYWMVLVDIKKLYKIKRTNIAMNMQTWHYKIIRYLRTRVLGHTILWDLFTWLLLYKRSTDGIGVLFDGDANWEKLTAESCYMFHSYFGLHNHMTIFWLDCTY